MKAILRKLWRSLPAVIAGACLALVISEVFPPCSIRFWRLAFAREWATFVGPGGSLSVESQLATSIGAAPTARFSFRLLYRVGNAQAKAYAIQGMQSVAWDDYCRFRDDFALSSYSVRTHIGCSVTTYSALLVADCIESWRFSSPEDVEKASREFNAYLEELRERKKAANQALQTTPMTLSVYEKTIEFGHPQRGV